MKLIDFEHTHTYKRDKCMFHDDNMQKYYHVTLNSTSVTIHNYYDCKPFV